ncbi:hypothetical protein [Jannaschia sp. LMIT008]|uniref:hypothetical protein n=1 Tax=Jannaschia maritima TaxID=3032585 RepID=UPI002810FC26|nr:hypothetical protein [Jannaschia sp. LMIT008]
MSDQPIQPGFGLFAAEGATAIGAVRAMQGNEMLVHVENYGEATLDRSHVASVHDGKVLLALDRLPDDLRDAVRHAHDAEDRRFRDHSGDAPGT